MSKRDETAASNAKEAPQLREGDNNESYKQLADNVHRELIEKNPLDDNTKRSTIAQGLLDGSLSWLGSVHDEPNHALADRLGLIKAVVEQLECLVTPEVIGHDRAEMDDIPTGFFAEWNEIVFKNRDATNSVLKPLGIARRMMGLDYPDKRQADRATSKTGENSE